MIFLQPIRTPAHNQLTNEKALIYLLISIPFQLKLICLFTNYLTRNEEFFPLTSHLLCLSLTMIVHFVLTTLWSSSNCCLAWLRSSNRTSYGIILSLDSLETAIFLIISSLTMFVMGEGRPHLRRPLSELLSKLPRTQS